MSNRSTFASFVRRGRVRQSPTVNMSSTSPDDPDEVRARSTCPMRAYMPARALSGRLRARSQPVPDVCCRRSSEPAARVQPFHPNTCT